MTGYFDVVILNVSLFWSERAIYREIKAKIPHLMSVHRIISKSSKKPTTFIRTRLSTFGAMNFLLRNGAMLSGYIYTVEPCRQQILNNKILPCSCQIQNSLSPELSEMKNNVHAIAEKLVEQHSLYKEDISQLKSLITSLQNDLKMYSTSKQSAFPVQPHSTPKTPSSSLISKTPLSENQNSSQDSAYTTWPEPKFDVNSSFHTLNDRGSVSHTNLATHLRTKKEYNTKSSIRQELESTRELENLSWTDVSNDLGLKSMFNEDKSVTKQNQSNEHTCQDIKLGKYFDEWLKGINSETQIVSETQSKTMNVKQPPEKIGTIISQFKGFS